MNASLSILDPNLNLSTTCFGVAVRLTSFMRDGDGSTLNSLRGPDNAYACFRTAFCLYLLAALLARFAAARTSCKNTNGLKSRYAQASDSRKMLTIASDLTFVSAVFVNLTYVILLPYRTTTASRLVHAIRLFTLFVVYYTYTQSRTSPSSSSKDKPPGGEAGTRLLRAQQAESVNHQTRSSTWYAQLWWTAIDDLYDVLENSRIEGDRTTRNKLAELGFGYGI